MKRLLPLILWLLFCGCAVLWLLTRPMELAFDCRTEQNCALSVCYSCGETFLDGDSRRETVTPWKTRYEFSLPGRTRQIRLIPGRLPGNRVTFRDLSLTRNGIFRTRIENPAAVLKPVRDVVVSDGQFQVTGSRPELEISDDLLGKNELDIRLCSLAGVVFLLVSMILFSLKAEDWTGLGAGAVRLAEHLQVYCRENRWFLIYAFCCLVILFGYELFNLPITEDDDWYLLARYEQLENSMPGAYSTLTYNSLTDNFIHHSRWASAFIVKYIFTGFSPVISLFWALLCFSVVFLVAAEKLKLPPAARYLFFPLFVGHPIFYEYFSFFMTNNTVGLIFLINFLLAAGWPNLRSRLGFLLLILTAVFCLSTLQSLIVVFPLWFLLKTMSDGLDRPVEYKKTFAELMKLCGVCLLILLVYFLSVKYTLWVFDIKNVDYLGNLIRKPDSMKAVMRFGWELMRKMLSVFSGRFEFAVHGQLLLFLLMAAAVLVRLVRKKRRVSDILLMVVALAGILALPFALDAASFNTAIPIRSMVSFPLMMTGLCILGWRALEDHPKLRLAAGLLTVLVSVQYGILINQKAYASKLRYEQDRSVVQSIKDRCYLIPEFTAALSKNGKIPLAVVGDLAVPKRTTFPMWNDSVLNCSFEPGVVVNLHLLGETYFYPASTAEMKKILPTAMSMPSWPEQGSVRFENGIMIVKLSEFDQFQCKRYGFPFRAVSRNNAVHLVGKLPAAVKPVWALTPETLELARACEVKFSQRQFTVVKHDKWYSLHTRAVKADPGKVYYLDLDLQNCPRPGYLYLGFSDPGQYGEEFLAEVEISPDAGRCCLRIPGRYLTGPVSIVLGNLHGKELHFRNFDLYELTGPENLLEP
ncbi:MAG: glucosyltransferase domain-containing protein [Lentisphaeria bacterium]|nr:glucosyltransferase domain-containing protein [Lentisphaeria bacterium]